ncbi:hypothetical protein [Streptomyces sp. NPDC020747]|uniref:hypothetical protein n=1 Tax=Streptomyces sp. NPDC020747 TaxID=3365086 RepID=UPI00378CCF29
MTDPTPDSTNPIAGRVEVRDPCPWCPGRPMIARTLMDDHVARLHPDVQTVDAAPAAVSVAVPPANRPPAPARVYRVSEIRDNELRRIHGYHASLNGAFTYCETEERKKPLVDSARFELFAAPGGRRWLIHSFYGPEDRFPETSDLLITEVRVIPDEADAVPPTVERRDRYAQALADALKPRYGGPQHNTPGGLPLTATAEEARLHRAQPLTAAVLAVADAEQADVRAAALREGADWFEADGRRVQQMFGHQAAAALRRLAAVSAVVPGAAAETQAGRGDAFEQWLKNFRDSCGGETDEWHAFDAALDRYRLHADTGTPLGEHVCEGRAVGDCGCLEKPAAVLPQPETQAGHEPRQSCACGQDGCEYCDVDEVTLLCPRCGDDISDYHEDDLVYRTGDKRPYCSGECVVATHRAALKEQPAVVSQPDEEAHGPRTVCTCGHTRGEHVAVSGRLLCDACDPDSTDNLVCKEFEAL